MPERPVLFASKYHTLDNGKRIRYAIFEPERVRGTFLISPGRREFIEKKYAELGPQLLERGFRLIFFEWRGQGLSDRWLSGPHRQRDHIESFDTHLDDLSSFYKKVVLPAKSGPLLVYGHSLGGHLTLRWLAERQHTDIAAAFVTAPMLALASSMVHTTARALSWTAAHLGHDADYAAAQHDYNASDREFKGNPLSHDPERFAVMEKYFLAYPDLTVGGVTWGWLEASLKSIHLVQHRKYFEKLDPPVLAIVGGVDHVTPTAELARFLKRLPKCETIVIPNALHDVMNETDGIRITAWGEIDRFLERILS